MTIYVNEFVIFTKVLVLTAAQKKKKIKRKNPKLKNELF